MQTAKLSAEEDGEQRGTSGARRTQGRPAAGLCECRTSTATVRLDLAEAQVGMPLVAEHFMRLDTDHDGKVTLDRAEPCAVA